MKIAVEGCCHGDLDAIYAHVAQLEARNGYKVDLLLICGDFQAMRNWPDLQVMAAPDKYKELKDFHKYYSGEKTAPILTIVIGGNHEASNYLWELYHGGWLAPNIYFIGHAGSVLVNGIRISGASGIFKAQDFRQGHHERLPYDKGTMRSIYHIREYCVRKLSLLPSPDIFISHDWPQGIEHHGDLHGLLRNKKYLKPDIDSGRLGSPPLMGLLTTLKPKWWFAAHMHTRFEATVAHYGADGAVAVAEAVAVAVAVVNPDEIVIDDDLDEVDEVAVEALVTPKTADLLRNPDEIMLSDEEDNVALSLPPIPVPVLPVLLPASVTHFLALDKCLPRRHFLEVLDIPTPDPLPAQTPTSTDAAPPSSTTSTSTSTPTPIPTLSYDPAWLAITRAFHPNLSLTRTQSAFPDETHARALVARELEWVHEHVPPKLDGSWAVGECQSFVMTAPPIREGQGEGGRKPAGRVQQPSWYTNPQTEAFCKMLEIPNKINPPPKGVSAPAPTTVSVTAEVAATSSA
ncbi:lariat debranching enzyme, C-terminal domain-containing protein [Lyophyllum atratum]|nr:lariat debranching enzyme, C-terminal domain-containing protein [Lyophyllum atratum]